MHLNYKINSFLFTFQVLFIIRSQITTTENRSTRWFRHDRMIRIRTVEYHWVFLLIHQAKYERIWVFNEFILVSLFPRRTREASKNVPTLTISDQHKRVAYIFASGKKCARQDAVIFRRVYQL